ncbi:MAG: nucleoside-diphosphate-sugar epimerase [Bacteroidia bacterium]|jgi:nucleoside-diphosphate-sugar epimerase
MSGKDKILIIGSEGQVGTDLAHELRSSYGVSNVVCCDVKEVNAARMEAGPYDILDVLDKKNIQEMYSKHKPTQIYHLAAMLSATAEKFPKKGWDLNMEGLFNIFDASLEYDVKRVFWPSSIAVFGPNTPQNDTPQDCVMDPNTIYGISKLAGERFCEYYFRRYGLDVRSIRYPGLIGWKALPGGGTTDYAVDIFHQALKHQKYSCFLTANTFLPMMYMDDAIKATINITEASGDRIKIRSSYNLSGMSFDPETLANAIRAKVPNFEMSYHNDPRQKIADSWPKSINDQPARDDWGWEPNFNLEKMVDAMLINLRSMMQAN